MPRNVAKSAIARDAIAALVRELFTIFHKLELCTCASQMTRSLTTNFERVKLPLKGEVDV